MPADHYIIDSDMTKVADAIRSKAGTTEPLLFPDGMKNAIVGINSEQKIALCEIRVEEFTTFESGHTRALSKIVSAEGATANFDGNINGDGGAVKFVAINTSGGSSNVNCDEYKVTKFKTSPEIYDGLMNYLAIDDRGDSLVMGRLDSPTARVQAQGFIRHNGKLYLRYPYASASVQINSGMSPKDCPLYFGFLSDNFKHSPYDASIDREIIRG